MSSLLKPRVVVGADPGQLRDLFTTQTFHSSRPTVGGRQTDLVGTGLPAPSPQERPELGRCRLVLTDR